jgi:ribosomal protein S18 acetylase RimI-like enzyme
MSSTPTSPFITYKIASTPTDFLIAEQLFRDYFAGLTFDISFQDLTEEFTNLAKKYNAPTGALILAMDEEKGIGCIGVRYLEEGIAEMKRLYVDPSYRGLQIGLSLIDQSLATAQALGYQKMRLDTITEMASAIKYYKLRGFYPIEPYCYNPLPTALYMEKELTKA